MGRLSGAVFLLLFAYAALFAQNEGTVSSGAVPPNATMVPEGTGTMGASGGSQTPTLPVQGTVPGTPVIQNPVGTVPFVPGQGIQQNPAQAGSGIGSQSILGSNPLNLPINTTPTQGQPTGIPVTSGQSTGASVTGTGSTPSGALSAPGSPSPAQGGGGTGSMTPSSGRTRAHSSGDVILIDDYTYDNRQEYRTVMQEKLRTYGDRINSLKRQADTLASSHEGIRRNVEQLQQIRNSLNRNITNAAGVEAGQWELFKAGIGDQFISLEKALARAEQDMRALPRENRYEEDESQQEGTTAPVYHGEPIPASNINVR